MLDLIQIENLVILLITMIVYEATGHLCYLVGSLFKGMQLWFYFPYEWRTKDQRFRKRLLAYLSFFPLQIVLAQGLSLLELLFFKVPLNMQLWLGMLLSNGEEIQLVVDFGDCISRSRRQRKLSKSCNDLLDFMHTFSLDSSDDE